MHMVATARLAPRTFSSSAAVPGQTGAGHAQGMAERDRAAIGIDALIVVGEAKVSKAGEDLACKGLVQLNHVETCGGPA